MAFHEIDRPPFDRIIEPSETDPTLVVPPLKLFTDELAFWRRRRQEADQAGDAVVRRMAEDSINWLRQVAVGRSAAEVTLTSNPREVSVRNWFVISTSVVAYIRLMREIDQLPDGPMPGFSFKPDINMAFDFYDRDLHRSGVHVTTGEMHGMLGVDPPDRGQECYYEGDAIYLRATTPASPTTGLMARFQDFMGQPFDPSGYTSVVPRLKVEFWRPE